MQPTNLFLENFRCFKSNRFDFNWINILTGTNNSGKSTLIKALLLLKDNKDLKKLRFTGDQHKLGKYQNIISNNAIDDTVTISFPLRLKYFSTLFILKLVYRTNKNGIISEGILDSLTVYESGSGEILFSCDTNIENISYKFRWNLVYAINTFDEFRLKARQNTTLLDIFANANSTNRQDIADHEIINLIYGLIIDEKRVNEMIYDDNLVLVDYERGVLESLKTEIINNEIEIINDKLNGYTSIDIMHTESHNPFSLLNFNFLNQTTSFDSSNHLLYNDFFKLFLNEKDHPINYYGHEYGDTFIPEIDKYFSTYGEIIIKEMIYKNIISAIHKATSEYENISFIPAIRGQIERIFIDTDKKNYLTQTILEFLQLKYDPYRTSEKCLNFINKYLQKFEFGNRLVIERNEEGIASFIYIENLEGKKVAIADCGYGLTQFLPILLQIVICGVRNLYGQIIIEEPETNLHPKLQSYLADLIIDANKIFFIKFIIETHSEYLIRKLQYLTGKGEIEPEMTQLYYFHHPEKIPKGEEQVKKINIEKDGSLTDNFGTGFFDEATHWKFELTRLKNSQQN